MNFWPVIENHGITPSHSATYQVRDKMLHCPSPTSLHIDKWYHTVLSTLHLSFTALHKQSLQHCDHGSFYLYSLLISIKHLWTSLVLNLLWNVCIQK